MKKILIIGPSWVGDMVMAQVLFKWLKQQDDSVCIDVLAPDWTRALLERMPEVNKALPWPIKHGELALKQRYQIGWSLRSQAYQQAIVLPNSFKSALVPFFAKIPIRTGWRRELRSILLTDARTLNKKQLPLMIERFLALGLTKGSTIPYHDLVPRLELSYDNLNQVREQYGLSQDERPVLVLCPGAEFGPAKRWPSEYYAEIANNFIAQGWQVWLLGSGNDIEVAEQIQVLTQQRSRNLIGRTNLGAAIDLLSLADLVLSNDSGLMHVAAALQRPQIVVYGSTDPGFTPPLNKQVKILRLNLPCSPCFKRVCPLATASLKCLTELKPAAVMHAAAALLPIVKAG